MKQKMEMILILITLEKMQTTTIIKAPKGGTIHQNLFPLAMITTRTLLKRVMWEHIGQDTLSINDLETPPSS